MRRTRQRQAILESLRAAARPLTPAEIAAAADRSAGGVNLATVYRNLKRMAEHGEVSSVECVGQPARYEIAGLDHHHHFHCEDCDRLFDLPGCAGEIERLAPAAFEVRRHHIQLSGRCGDCSARR